MAKYYYNGVLLPEIPADVLVEYPYCWIRKHTTNAMYQLICSPTGFYYNGSGLYDLQGVISKQYNFPIGDTAETSWTDANNTTYSGWGIDTNRPCIWSNHDIPNGSATATEMYFLASEPMPENNHSVRLEYVKSTGYAYIDTGVIPNGNTIAEVTYHTEECIMYGCHVLSTKSWYFPFARNYGGVNHFFASNLGSELRIDDDSAVGQKHTVKAFPDGKIVVDGKTIGNLFAGSNAPTTNLYLLAYGGSPDSINYKGTCRIYDCKIWQSNELIRHYIPYNQKGVCGLLETVSGDFHPSEGSLAFMAGSVSSESKYLIQSGDSLFTVTDGVLTAVDGLLTAELFRTYGVDDIPSSELLITLTDPIVLHWNEADEIIPLVAVVKGIPHEQTVESPDYNMNHSSIVGIEKVLVNASDDVRFAISFDSGQTWYTHTGQAWGMLSGGDTGMSPSVLSAITTEDWKTVATTGKFRFRVTLPTVDSCVNSLVVDYLN